MTRTVRALIVSAVALGVLVPAGAASARPVTEPERYCPPGTYLQVAHCEAYPVNYGPGGR